jgi:chromosome segregation ATPase
MFQKFNHELNEITKKRSVLEQIILKKEKDIDERDQILFEKIAALEESERILSMRQAEIESFDNTIKRLNEQKESIKKEIIKNDEEVAERKNLNEGLKLETELLMKKRSNLEKSLQELLKMVTENFYKVEERKHKLEEDVRIYDDKLNDIKEKINNSMKELVEIQESIGTHKIEAEEYKNNISKLLLMKKRLNEEIQKQQAALQKFQKIREKLKIERVIAKNTSGGPYPGEMKESITKSVKGDPSGNAQIFKI